jgi:xanthosine utilization system XapX-like protein/phage FluMu protein Com
MIRKSCDRCDRLIEVDDAKAGLKVDCPACGDVNIMPATPAPGSTTSGISRAAAKGYPPDKGPEVSVIQVRRAVFRARPISFSLVALISVASLVFALIHLVSPAAVPMWLAIVCLLALLAGGGTLGYWWIESLVARLEVTNKRTIARRGLLSRSTSEVLHDNIRNVQIDQSFWERVWQVGSIGISSSGQDGIEIQMQHVPQPDRLKEVIDLYRPLD